ncbi:hypothetical protein SS50377_28187 [Spironucleus salmonicida]|uniref:SHIPPO 1-like protein n=1 Tax=Spironucleus salmonicida TaxID=348837 RepID=V6LZT9_9EUKA|nr:hypothetical protein SS50377_28187 [Spironucleus salmonicida]|eukprot:EST46369.1 hypothetical protein SS50377_13612 [Spironucleus salmonicida]
MKNSFTDTGTIFNKKQSISPGPAAYNISLAASFLKKAHPSFSIYKKPHEKRIDKAPSPASYSIPSSYNQSHGLSIQNRGNSYLDTIQQQSNPEMSPGTYTPKSSTLVSYDTKIKNRYKELIQQSPGPNAYNLSSAPAIQEIKMKFSSKDVFAPSKAQMEAPAPNKYYVNTKFTAKQTGDITFSKGSDTEKIDQKPSPSQYHPNFNYSKKDAPSFTFGSRRSCGETL